MNRLAELRERRALTLRELAEMSGVAADTINQIELGHRKARPSTLRKLAAALRVEISDFFEKPELHEEKPELPEGFDVVAITREVETEYPELPRDSAEFRNLVTRRCAEELGHLSKANLAAISADLRERAKRMDTTLRSPMWEDPAQYSAWLRLWDERRAVQQALYALDRVLTEA